MAKSSKNPLKWFKRTDSEPAQSSSDFLSASTLKPPAQPRKHMKVLMRLEAFQRNLQPLAGKTHKARDAALLAKNIGRQLLLIKYDAEEVGKDDVAKGAGQVMDYLQTVEQGGFDLDGEAVSLILDFAGICQNSLQDMSAETWAQIYDRFQDWENRYQSLMDRTKPAGDDTVRDSAGGGIGAELKPEVADYSQKRGSSGIDQSKTEPVMPRGGWNGEGFKSPVNHEEIQRLKSMLLELHEKQEMLSSKMSGLLDGLEKTDKDKHDETRDAKSVDKLDDDDLEDMIFIGRDKG